MESGPVILLVAAVLIATCVYILSPITCLAILKTPSLRHNHSNLFLLNLGLVDMLLVVLVIAFNVFTLLDVRDNQTACVISIVAFGTMVMASLLSSFAIAVDRFLFIHKAITYNIIVTQGRVLKTVAVIWIVSLVNGLIPLLGDLTKTDACIHPATKALCLQGILIVSLFLTTGVISVCLYGKLFFIIRQHNHVLETHARAHCRTHDCKKQACRIKSRLGECHFQQLSLPSSLSYTRSETFDTEDSRTSLMAKCETRLAPITTQNGIAQSVQFSLSLDYPDQTKVTADEQEACTSAAKASLWSWIKVQTCGLYRRRLKRDNASISRESTFVSFHIPSPEDRANVDQHDNIDRTNVDQHDNIDMTNVDQHDNIDRTNVVHEADILAHPTKLKKRKTRKVRFLKCQHLRDLRTIKTLMLMFVIYFICWSPIMVCKFAFHLLMVDIDKKWFYTAWIVGASNSLWNFAVYPLRKAELRRAIRKILCSVFTH